MQIAALIALTALQSPTPADLYKSYREKIASANSITGMVTVEMGKPVPYEFFMEKPGKVFVGSDTQQIISNGTKVWQFMAKRKEYNEPPFEHYGRGILIEPLKPFFEGVELKKQPKDIRLADFEGRRLLEIVEVEEKTVSLRAFIDPDALLPVAWIQDAGGKKTVSRFSNLKFNVPVDPSKFELPKDAKPMIGDSHDDKLLKPGTMAPNFTADRPKGGKIDLKSELKGSKILWLNFWFFACGPCQEELPKLNSIYNKLKDQGLKVITVNHGDTAKLINEFVAEKKFNFPVAMGSTTKHTVSDMYGVTGYPTNYLIAPEGKIIARFVGFNEKAILAELEKAGLKP